jgi:putative photosynthetic complex assembly protein 2
MVEFALPACYAILVWWFTTGLILFLDGLPRSTFRWSMSAATAILLAALYVMRLSCEDSTSAGAYTAFSCTILVWGWLEMSFLMGFITGPRKHACGEPCGGWRHFLHAVEAVIYNEVALLAGAVVIFAITFRAPNRLALWTYLILWCMRLSAKLNLFLGVPNRGERFLPAHLHYLKSFFSKRTMNALFPVSVLASIALTVILAQRYVLAANARQSGSYALLTTLLALGVLEHGFMVIPLPSEKLWNWALKRERMVKI